MSHFMVSLLKSAWRIAGCAILLYNRDIIFCAWMFIFAEVLGVVEELVDKRKENV